MLLINLSGRRDTRLAITLTPTRSNVMTKVNGVVFYEGKSLIDGKPIVAIATFGTHNEKTGNIVQTWILRNDMHPQEAIDSGNDLSICGNCPLRGRIAPLNERLKPRNYDNKLTTTNKDRSCYVLAYMAPAQVYKSYKQGKYPKLSEEHRRLMLGRGLRYGSYGDPVAVPLKNWDQLAKFCTGKARPGYTHQWKNPKFAQWSTRLMASTHTLEENKAAHQSGWRTFRTIGDVSQLNPDEIVCPASEEGGFVATCETCGACNGRKNLEDSRRNVAILAHGGGGKDKRIRELMTPAA